MEEYIDITGVPLTPGDMRNCAGNGKFYAIDENGICKCKEDKFLWRK